MVSSLPLLPILLRWGLMKQEVNHVNPSHNCQLSQPIGCLVFQSAGGLSSLTARRQRRPRSWETFKNPPPHPPPSEPYRTCPDTHKERPGQEGSYGRLNGEASLPNIFDCSLNGGQAVSQFIFCWAAKSEVFDITQICHPNKRKKKVWLLFTPSTPLQKQCYRREWLKSASSGELWLLPP